MLSYRHGFHAGNAADVLKHMVLIFCLDYLSQKEKPYLCIDTHAGAGSYPLLGVFAAKNREWDKGVARLGIGAMPEADPLPAMIRRYLEIIGPGFAAAAAAANPAALSYSGSPEIIRRMLRDGDKACCFELHPEDFAALNSLLGSDRRFSLRRADGFEGLKGLLPPLPRRGLIFIDPPYEVKDDYLTLPHILSDALKRFPAGTYIIWYPLLHIDPRPGENIPFRETLLDLYDGNRLGLEFYTAPKDNPLAEGVTGNSPRGMYGSGMVIFNHPWTLKQALEESLPFLGEIMGVGKNGWLLCNHEAP
ncbi:ribosomal RNA large subunit methyltransferase J [Spirochaetia bacterium]|nr:ribosomal RNA large subunit methyltransferase J [Spirochaetia bacterium]